MNAATPTIPVRFPAGQFRRIPSFRHADNAVSPGVTGIWYEGLPWQGKLTEVFAWYGLPEKAADKGCPGMVLLHGGGGTAMDDWVRLWTGRGYAAIAMDLCGHKPDTVPARSMQWSRHKTSGPEGWNASFHQMDAAAEDHWQYHAIGAAMRGYSLLASMPQVDARRIGVTGISWGGYLTCLVAGMDRRFRFAVPVYGCGFLADNSAWLDCFAAMDHEARHRWVTLWDPSQYLPSVTIPMLWVTGTNDFAYPLDSLQKSYRLTQGQRTLCIRKEMPHGHGVAGENPAEIHAFARSLLEGEAPLPQITEQGRDGRDLWCRFETTVPVTQAELIFTRASGYWQDRRYNIEPATLDQKSRSVHAVCPPRTTVAYLNLIDKRECVVSTQHVTFES